MEKRELSKRDIQIAEAIRDLCVKEAKEGFRDDSMEALRRGCSGGSCECNSEA